MPPKILSFHVICGRRLWSFVHFMWGRAMATAALQGKVQTARARCILSAVIIASILMCSEDAECQVDQKINNENEA